MAAVLAVDNPQLVGIKGYVRFEPTGVSADGRPERLREGKDPPPAFISFTSGLPYDDLIPSPLLTKEVGMMTDARVARFSVGVGVWGVERLQA